MNSNRHHANWLHQMAQLTVLPPNQIDNIARQLGGLFELELLTSLAANWPMKVIGVRSLRQTKGAASCRGAFATSLSARRLLATSRLSRLAMARTRRGIGVNLAGGFRYQTPNIAVQAI